MAEQQTTNYGNRADGSPKGRGFLGELKRPDGNISTEVSIGVDMDGQEVEIPSLVPGLSDDEVNAVLNDEMPDSVVEKAVEHARKRMGEGKSPFFGHDDESPSQTSNPWDSQEWGNVDSYIEQQASPQEPSNATPWASDWGTGTSYLGNGVMPRSASFGGRGPDNSSDGKFDRVFRNLILQESGGQHTDRSGQLTTSPVGAQGITQVMPKTGKNPGYGIQPLQNDSEEEYIRFGKDYLNAMLTEFNGNYEQALAAYNAGAGNVKKAIERGGSQWKDFLPKKKETIPYVQNILRGINAG